jgi:hypothetical protein
MALRVKTSLRSFEVYIQQTSNEYMYLHQNRQAESKSSKYQYKPESPSVDAHAVEHFAVGALVWFGTGRLNSMLSTVQQ